MRGQREREGREERRGERREGGGRPLTQIPGPAPVASLLYNKPFVDSCVRRSLITSTLGITVSLSAEICAACFILCML